MNPGLPGSRVSSCCHQTLLLASKIFPLINSDMEHRDLENHSPSSVIFWFCGLALPLLVGGIHLLKLPLIHWGDCVRWRTLQDVLENGKKQAAELCTGMLCIYIFFFFLKGKYMHNCWNKPRLWKETLEMVQRDCFGGGTEEGRDRG